MKLPVFGLAYATESKGHVERNGHISWGCPDFVMGLPCLPGTPVTQSAFMNFISFSKQQVQTLYMFKCLVKLTLSLVIKCEICDTEKEWDILTLSAALSETLQLLRKMVSGYHGTIASHNCDHGTSEYVLNGWFDMAQLNRTFV